MRVHGGARSAAVRDPKVRLRGLSEIATNPPLLLFAAPVLPFADQDGAWPRWPSMACRQPASRLIAVGVRRLCRLNAPFAELVRLSRTSIADEMREEHRRRVLGE
jgi:hypothetical protein